MGPGARSPTTGSRLARKVSNAARSERGRVAVPNRWSPLTRGVPSGE